MFQSNSSSGSTDGNRKEDILKCAGKLAQIGDQIMLSIENSLPKTGNELRIASKCYPFRCPKRLVNINNQNKRDNKLYVEFSSFYIAGRRPRASNEHVCGWHHVLTVLHASVLLLMVDTEETTNSISKIALVWLRKSRICKYMPHYRSNGRVIDTKIFTFNLKVQFLFIRFHWPKTEL